MDFYQNILVAGILTANLIGYGMMCFDKYQSKNKGHRISERSLLFMAFLLGGIGVYCGMKAPLYHKSSKKYFRLGIPLLIGINVVMVFCLAGFLKK